MFKQEKHAQRKDKSKKGSIDPAIKTVVDYLNRFKDYFTTSSCSGRIVLLERHKKKCDSRFLFCSHVPVKQDVLWRAIKDCHAKLLWLKMEPLIVHVRCRDVGSAAKLLHCTQGIGLKHSGILSIRKRIVVEINGVEQLEAPIGTGISQGYAQELARAANEKLRRNRQRIRRLETALQSLPPC